MSKATLQLILDKIDAAMMELESAALLAHASEDRREVRIRHTIAALADLYYDMKGSK